LTLKKALAWAVEKNPILLLSRLDQEKARDQGVIAKEPFCAENTGGSGLAYSGGYPTTIDAESSTF